MRSMVTIAVFFPMVAGAAPVALGDGDFLIPEPVERLDRDTHDLLLEEAAGRAPAGSDVVTLWALAADGTLVSAESLIPPAEPPPEKEGETGRSWPADSPGATDGFLSDRAVYLSQCHGYIWYDSLADFSTQRGEHFDTVEDLHNPEALNQFLAPYLENAGAAVFTVKERGMNPLMAIADNDGEGYSESGSGFVGGPAGFAEKATWLAGEDPFDHGTTRRFPADGGGKATWIPDVPADGYYAVYVSWDSDAAHPHDAHYRITHKGGVIDRWFDQTVHGSTWQYVETLWLEQGVDSLTVELIGDSSESGKMLNADAVRIGGGTSDVVRNGDLSGRPRWEEGAQLYTQFNGAPSTIYGAGDVTARSRWAAWEHPSGEDALFLSWHSNACGTGDECAARGTVTYIYAGPDGGCTNGDAVTGSYDLAKSVNDELVGAFRALWEPGWTERGDGGVASACFGEVNPGNNAEMPSALVELAFHNNETDATYLKEPEFRRDAARAMYRGIVRYWAERDGVTPAFVPEPPDHLAITHAGTGLRASWQAGPSGDPFGDPTDSFLVQTSTDGRAWDVGTAVTGTTTVLSTAVGEAVYVRVVGVNEGGVSFPSEVVGARLSPEGAAPILVVSAFDRLDTGLLAWVSKPRVGNVREMIMPRVNPGNVAAITGDAIAGAGWYFDSVSDEVFDDLDLSPYGLVVWAAGEESTVDESFSRAQQDKLRAWVAGGGALWASGAEVLWDLDERGDTDDQAFAAEVLGATMASDDAETDVVTGEGLLADVGALDFGDAAGAAYPVEYPDTLTTERTVIARYAGGAIAGAMSDDVVLFGFPFEAIGDRDVRVAVAERLLPALLPDVDPPDPPTTDGWDRHEIPGPACGCATGAAPSPASLLLVLVVVAARRRRLAAK